MADPLPEDPHEAYARLNHPMGSLPRDTGPLAGWIVKGVIGGLGMFKALKLEGGSIPPYWLTVMRAALADTLAWVDREISDQGG